MDITTFSYTGVLIFVSIVTGIQGLTVTSSRVPTGTLTIGDNQFTISCTYTKQNNDIVFAIELWRKRSTDNAFVKIVSFPPPTSATNVTISDPDLVDRTTATRHSDSSPTASLTFDNTLCTDKADYQWRVAYYDTESRSTTLDFIIDSLKSLNKFKDTGVLTFNPSTNIVEGTEVTFTCTGDVGDVPAGGLAWYMYRNGETSGGENLSGQATAMAPVAGQCTYSRTSTLKLTMQSNMNNVLIRCTVQQDVNDEHGDDHKQTIQIPVLYAPKGLAIKKEPNLPSYAEGEQKLTLTCSADANPAASYYWVLPSLPGTNGTDSTNSTELIGAVLTLTDLNETDSGTYTCVGYNPINGQNNTVNTSVNILIQRTTTTSTTTPSPTSGTTEAPAGNTQTKDDDNKTTTIIIVVCVVLGVIVIIVVVVLICIKKRKNKKDPIEEPPEKPIRNNQDMSYFSNRPDLVSADQGMKNNALNASFNNSFDSTSDIKSRNEDGLNYVDLQFDDKPRSRRPIQLIDNGSMPYTDIAMPRV